MFHLDNTTNENNKEPNKEWPYIPDHPYRILIIEDSGSRKTNVLLNSISRQDDIHKIYLDAKDLIQRLEKVETVVSLKHLSNFWRTLDILL